MSSPVELRIEKAIYGGAGLARHAGKAVFVPFTMPGELVTATVTRDKGSFAEATLASLLEPSPERSTPPCPYFGVCGGCHYQHASAAAQLAMKAAILEETLTRAGLGALPPIVTHAGAPLGYRNRVRMHIDPLTSAVGYRERGSHRLLPVSVCPIAAPELQQALGGLVRLAEEQQCGRHFSELELSVNHDGTAMLLSLWLRVGASAAHAAKPLARICEGLQALVPSLQGAGVQAAPLPTAGRGRSARRGWHGSDQDGILDGAADEGSSTAPRIASWGTPRMIYRAAGFDYQVSLGAFFQVNRTLVDRLVELAIGTSAVSLAWDIYAGVGLFSRVLAGCFEQVVAVEGAPVSCADLRVNLGRPHRVVESSTLDFLRREASARSRVAAGRGAPPPDFVLVDPPRAGLGAEVTMLLGELRPAAITYVSCDPATLGRDLAALVKSGYQLQQLHMIDLFPQTFHLEAVATLSLG